MRMVFDVRAQLHGMRNAMTRSLRQPHSFRRLATFAVGLSAGLSALVGVRSIHWGDLEESCTERPLACSLASSAVTSATTAALVSLIWAGGIARAAAMHRYRRAVRSDPGRTLGGSWVGSVERFRGRDAFISELFVELRDSARRDPIVIVADAGVGKTSILILLAHRLSTSGFVPVLLPMRGQTLPLDVDRLAIEALRREMSRQALTPSTVDRICLSVQRSGRLVALLDGLDEVDPADPIARRQVELAAAMTSGSHSVRIVATTRPSVLSAVLPASLFPVPPLDLEDAVSIVQPGDLGDDHLESVVKAGKLDEAPFFLQWMRKGGANLDPLRPAGVIRYDILAAAMETLPPEACTRLGRLALALCVAGRYELGLDEATRILESRGVTDSDGFDYRQAIESGQARGVTEMFFAGDGIRFGFAHAQLLAFFLSEHLRARPQSLTMLAESATLPEVALGSAWASPLHGCGAYLKEIAGTLPGSLAVAACVQVAASHGHPLPTAVNEVDEGTEWNDASAERAMVETLASLTADPVAVEMLTRRESHRLYQLRWSAANALSSGGPETFELLAPSLKDRLDSLGHSMHGPSFDPLAIQEGPLWYLPGLVAGCTMSETTFSTAQQMLRDYEAVVEAASSHDVAGALGAESSLAQGYKLAALKRPGVLDQQGVQRLALGARFWYARIEAIHAIALDSIASGIKETDTIELAREKELHPLVQAVAGLAAEALRTGDQERWLWIDEHSVVRAPSSRLNDEATQVLGELVLLLNLSENGPQHVRDANASAGHLPPCLTFDAARVRLTSDGGCTAGCSFGLCPYPTGEGSDRTRGSFSEAFVRRMRRTVDRGGPPQWFAGRRSSYLEFWNKIERSDRL